MGTKTAAHANVAQSALTSTAGLSACTIAGTAGLCLTPTKARGKVVSLSLVQTAMGAPPVRLFGTGEGLDRDGRISLAGFDLANPVGIPGEGTLQEVSPGTSFTQMDTLFGYVDVQIPLNDTFWTVRFAFYPQPIATDPLVVMCSDVHRLENIAKNGAVIDGAPDFARGDVMYCQKSAASDECAPTDFSWIDSGSKAFVTTRPTSPRRLDYIVQNGIQCMLYPEGPTAQNHNQPGELLFNGFHMGSRFTTPVGVWARFSECNKIFTTKDSTGAFVDGTSLSATINYDLGGFVFFPGITDAANATPEALLNVVTLAPIFGRQVLGAGPGGGEFSTATLTLTLGHEPSSSCGGGSEGPDGGATGSGG